MLSRCVLRRNRQRKCRNDFHVCNLAAKPTKIFNEYKFSEMEFIKIEKTEQDYVLIDGEALYG